MVRVVWRLVAFRSSFTKHLSSGFLLWYLPNILPSSYSMFWTTSEAGPGATNFQWAASVGFAAPTNVLFLLLLHFLHRGFGWYGISFYIYQCLFIGLRGDGVGGIEVVD